MKTILAFFLLSVSACASANPAPIQTPAPMATQVLVERYVAAFNARNVEAMADLMHEDIQWMTVTEDKSSATTQGKEAMVREMTEYFQSPSKTTSTLKGWGTNGSFISVVETASWAAKDGTQRAQSSNTVYQIEAGLIRRVWYFPEQK